VESVDVVPTLLACAGIPVPSHLQGRSLWDRQAPAGPFQDRGSALMEHAGWKTLRTDRYRYLVEADGSEKLWDLEEDPGEYQDVAGEPSRSRVLAEHRRLLLQRLLELERPRPRIWPY
jgi:arylsulfatase A-like enzyme